MGRLPINLKLSPWSFKLFTTLVSWACHLHCLVQIPALQQFVRDKCHDPCCDVISFSLSGVLCLTCCFDCLINIRSPCLWMLSCPRFAVHAEQTIQGIIAELNRHLPQKCEQTILLTPWPIIQAIGVPPLPLT